MATIATELIETKRDERGRQMRSAEERESLLQAYRESGLTQQAFAAQQGIAVFWCFPLTNFAPQALGCSSLV